MWTFQVNNITLYSTFNLFLSLPSSVSTTLLLVLILVIKSFGDLLLFSEVIFPAWRLGLIAFQDLSVVWMLHWILSFVLSTFSA